MKEPFGKQPARELHHLDKEFEEYVFLGNTETQVRGHHIEHEPGWVGQWIPCRIAVHANGLPFLKKNVYKMYKSLICDCSR